MVNETPIQALTRMTTGYQVSQAIHAAAELGIADELASGPRTSGEVAATVGSDPNATYRLMRALAAVGVFEEGPDRIFSLTPIGDHLRSDSPTSVRDWAVWIGQESFWNTWGKLTTGIQTGRTVFPQVHGKSVWEYRAERPQLSAIFDRAMSAITASRRWRGPGRLRLLAVRCDCGHRRRQRRTAGPGPAGESVRSWDPVRSAARRNGECARGCRRGGSLRDRRR